MHSVLSHHNFPPQPATVARFHDRLNNERGMLRRMWDTLNRNWNRRKMIVALRAMDDRLLRDIGVERCDIIQVVDGFDERELRMVPLAPRRRPILDDQYSLRLAA